MKVDRPIREQFQEEVPVLVAGAGPAGLTAAVALALNGVEVLLVERRGRLSALPRATALSTRTMELLRSWGLEEEVRAGGVEAEWLAWVCDSLAAAAGGHAEPLGLPTSEQAALVSPTRPACAPQDHLEPVLLRHLLASGSARVRFATEVVAAQPAADGVRVVLRAGREEEVVHARHLVAADGAHSRIRRALGIRMEGPTGLAAAATALFRAPLWRLVEAHPYGLYDIAPANGGGVFLPAGRGDRWLYGVERDDPVLESPDGIARRIRRASGVPDLEPRIERVGTFEFAAQVADRFRHGGTFLVGDAAHRITPRGGTGMNTAMHDGFDLGWKLGWVLRGWAGAGLLDSYEAERRPVVEHNVARSAQRDGSARTAASELHVDLGGRIPHLWLEGRVSTLDLLGAGLTLFTGPDHDAWAAAAASLPGPLPTTVRRLDAVSARALGVAAGG
ncbi:MAG TPA: FAD-dependent monooxygenase, partial [Solirubrobacteraceae bacterium]|nr:FAD-dependent monooxygenase [Solirubrobacteraceae bacterium]